VWFADRPDVNEEAMSWPLLELEIPADLLERYEWVDHDVRYHEWLIPAALANQYGPPRLVSSEEESKIISAEVIKPGSD
jgi:hypothetical protein